MDDFLSHVSTYNPDYVAVTESWLHDLIPDNYIAIPSYQLFRNDRVGRKGGGVCFWCRNGLHAELITASTNDLCECTVVFIHETNSLVFTIYIPPSLCNINCADIINDFIIKSCDDFLNLKPLANIFIIGDFNTFDYNGFSVHLALKPIVFSATRKDAILDNIFVPDHFHSVYNVQVGSCLQGMGASSDHCCIFAFSDAVNDNLSVSPRYVRFYDYTNSAMADCITY
jgi:hypothetical protein